MWWLLPPQLSRVLLAARQNDGHTFKLRITSTSYRASSLLQAIYLLTTGAREAAFRNIKTIAECLADELINAAKGSSNRCHSASYR
jgi:ribosomal protein S7